MSFIFVCHPSSSEILFPLLLVPKGMLLARFLYCSHILPPLLVN